MLPTMPTPAEIRSRIKDTLPDHSICKQCAVALNNSCYFETRKVHIVNKRMGITECSGFTHQTPTED